jgi:hypothetical protein
MSDRIQSRLLLPARHPNADVRWTVAKRNALTFAPAQEADGLTIDENQVLEVQYDRPVCRFRCKQLKQLPYVAGLKPTDNGEYHFTVCMTLYLQHGFALPTTLQFPSQPQAADSSVIDSLIAGETSPMVKCWTIGIY